MPIAATGGIRTWSCSLPSPTLSSILVSDDSAWGLWRGKLLPDALRGTSIVEAAGILVPLGNLGFSGELLDLSVPELSLGGVNPDCIFYQGTARMGPGASKLKHLPVKQQDKTRTTKGTAVQNETRYWVCRCTTSGKTKDNDRQNCIRASYLFGFWFYAEAPTKSPVMPKLDADKVQATRKLTPTARELISPQGHRCVIAQKVIHPVVTDCTFQLRPPTQSTRFIHRDGVDVGTCSFVTNVLVVVNVDVSAARC